MLKCLLIPLLMATAEYAEGPKKATTMAPKGSTKEPSAYSEAPQHVPTVSKGPKKANNAYAEGPPKNAPKRSKAPRVQNQQPQLIDIFLGVGQIICGATGQCQPRNPCPAGTVFRQGCPCEPTCANQNPPCNSQCSRPRCQCAQGRVRNANGQCVAPSACPSTTPTCPAGQVFMTGCPCEGTCANRNPPCTLQCSQQSRCQCAQGTVRNANGQCVSPSNCPSTNPTCPSGQVFMTGCPCERSCTNSNLPCTWQCSQSRCQCAQGTVRNANGQCVSPSSCTTTNPNCPSNQYWNTCPPPAGCEPSCQNYSPNCNWFACGGARCTCRPGFYRQSSAPNAPCVQWQQCWQWGGSHTNPGPPNGGPQGGRPWWWWIRG